MTTRGWERRQLEELVTKGKAAAAKIEHANILLKVDADGPGWTDEAAAQAFRCTATTVHHVRQRFVEQGFEAALVRNKQSRPFPARRDTFDGAKEARLIALACSQPPAGRARWTLELLVDKVVAGWLGLSPRSPGRGVEDSGTATRPAETSTCCSEVPRCGSKPRPLRFSGASAEFRTANLRLGTARFEFGTVRLKDHVERYRIIHNDSWNWRS